MCYFDGLVYVARVPSIALGSHFCSSFAAWSVRLNLRKLLNTVFIGTRLRPLLQLTLELSVLLLKLNWQSCLRVLSIDARFLSWKHILVARIRCNRHAKLLVGGRLERVLRSIRCKRCCPVNLDVTQVDRASIVWL